MEHAKIGNSFIPLCKHGNVVTLCTPCVIDSLQQRAESAETRAAQLEAENKCLRGNLEYVQAERDELRRKLSEPAWAQLRAERDELQRQLEQAQVWCSATKRLAAKSIF